MGGVFAIVLTLLVLDIQAPEASLETGSAGSLMPLP
ncbi:hypothetical protein [Nostoc sp.]